MGNNAIRSICLAYKDLPDSIDTDLSDSKEEDFFNEENKSLIFLGVLGNCDVLREGVSESIQRCK